MSLRGEPMKNSQTKKDQAINNYHLVFFSTRTRDIDMKTHENE